MDESQKSVTPVAAGTLQQKNVFVKNNVFNLKEAWPSGTKMVVKKFSLPF
jgi:hypothetical protein